MTFALKQKESKDKSWVGLAEKHNVSSTTLKKMRLLILGTTIGYSDDDYDTMDLYMTTLINSFNREADGYIPLCDWCKDVKKKYMYITSSYHSGHGTLYIKQITSPFDKSSHRLFIKQGTTYQQFKDDWIPNPKNKKEVLKPKGGDKRSKEYRMANQDANDELGSMLFYAEKTRNNVKVDYQKQTINGLKVSWLNERLILEDGTDLNDYINYVLEVKHV